jgi:hypothetical protein
MNEDSIRVVIAVATGIVAISTASIFIKLCDAHPLVIASYRLGLASLILAQSPSAAGDMGKFSAADGNCSSPRAFSWPSTSPFGSPH